MKGLHSIKPGVREDLIAVAMALYMRHKIIQFRIIEKTIKSHVEMQYHWNGHWSNLYPEDYKLYIGITNRHTPEEQAHARAQVIFE